MLLLLGYLLIFHHRLLLLYSKWVLGFDKFFKVGVVCIEFCFWLEIYGCCKLRNVVVVVNRVHFLRVSLFLGILSDLHLTYVSSRVNIVNLTFR